jgi:hypothetical protein
VRATYCCEGGRLSRNPESLPKWLAEHPGRKPADYRAGLKDFPDGEVFVWRRAKAKAADKAMRRAWRREHPGEEPLPEHLCALDHPLPGFKRWAAKASRWIDRYYARSHPRSR